MTPPASRPSASRTWRTWPEPRRRRRRRRCKPPSRLPAETSGSGEDRALQRARPPYNGAMGSTLQPRIATAEPAVPLVEELTPAPDPWDVARRLAHLPHLLFLDSAAS